MSLVPCPSGPLAVAGVVSGSERPLRLSLVIPTFNERNNIGSLIDQLTALLDPVLGDAYELIIVDDDSPDRTWELALELAAKHPKLRVMRRQGEKGLSTAVIRGWQIARGEVLAVIDADLQHPPEVTVKLWNEIEGNADLAVGSRHVDGGGVSDWSLLRRMLSRGAQLLGLMVLPGVLGRVSDPMSGYFMVRRRAIADVVLSPLGYKILVEVIGRGRIRWIAEVGYVFRERNQGESKVTWRVYASYLRHLARLRLATLPASRFFKFAVVGASGVVVDMAVLFLLSDPRALGLGLTRSKLAAAELRDPQQLLVERRVDVPRHGEDAAQLAAQASPVREVQHRVRHRPGVERRDDQRDVQRPAHEPLRREPDRDRRGHGVELLGQLEGELERNGRVTLNGAPSAL